MVAKITMWKWCLLQRRINCRAWIAEFFSNEKSQIMFLLARSKLLYLSKPFFLLNPTLLAEVRFSNWYFCCFFFHCSVVVCFCWLVFVRFSLDLTNKTKKKSSSFYRLIIAVVLIFLIRTNLAPNSLTALRILTILFISWKDLFEKTTMVRIFIALLYWLIF